MIDKDIEILYQSALSNAQIKLAFKKNVQKKNNQITVSNQVYNVNDYENIYICGVGKAVCEMADSLLSIFEKDLSSQIKIAGGCIITKKKHCSSSLIKHIQDNSIEVIESSHPVPDETSLSAGQKLLSLFKDIGSQKNLIFFLITGGGSSLITLPVHEISLTDLIKTTQLLLMSEATIQEINCIRKHLSQIKGGKLTRQINKATCISLLVSDVVGDDLSSIASGPLVADNTTFKDAQKIISKYNLEKKIPKNVLHFIENGLKGIVEETVKKEELKTKEYVGGCIIQHQIILSNISSLMVVKEQAERLNYNTCLLSSSFEGSVKENALFHLSIIREVINSNHPVSMPACILSGGESTISIHRDLSKVGQGGRNQHFVMELVEKLSILDNHKYEVIVLSFGTDGTDGLTDATGAFIDTKTYQKGISLGLDYKKHLKQFDSYNYFKKTENLIITGPTGTNIMDIRIIIIREI